MARARKQPAKKRVDFKLMAPEAEEVKVLGDFTSWDKNARPLKRTKEGAWQTHLSLEPGRYEYRYLVDGQWQNESDAHVVNNPFGTQNCVRVVD